METFFNFLAELQRVGTHYRIEYHSAPEFGQGYRTLTVHITASPAERWEVEFHDDATVDIERFTTTGIQDADLDSLLDELRSDQ